MIVLLPVYSFSLRKILIDGLESCGLLWCFYQLFGLSFWRHPFTAVDPLVSKWCNATFLQICSDEETKFHFWVDYSFKWENKKCNLTYFDPTVGYIISYDTENLISLSQWSEMFTISIPCKPKNSQASWQPAVIRENNYCLIRSDYQPWWSAQIHMTAK